MFFSTPGGLITCLFFTALSLIAAYTAKPKELTTPVEKTLFCLFQLVLASSVWGLAEPRIGSAVTTFRVSLLLFAMLYIFWAFRSHSNPFQGFSACRWSLLAILAFMAGYGAVTLLFLTPDRSYTFSRLTNLGFDILLCIAVLFYLRSRQFWTSVVRNLAMILAGQMAIGFYECFAGSIYTDTHIKAFGIDFFGLYMLRLPSGTFYNTNDYCATLFFLAMPVLVHLLHGVISGKRRGASLAAITLIFCMQWFLCSCGGAILVQIGVFLFFLVAATFLVIWIKQQRYFGALMAVALPILFAVIIYIAPAIKLSNNTALHPPVYLPSSVSSQIVSGSSASSKAITSSKSSTTGSSQAHANPSKAATGKKASTATSSQSASKFSSTNRNDFSGLGVGSQAVMSYTTFCRKTLLKFAMQTFASHPLGVGLGNTQLLAGPAVFIHIGNINKLHCYIAECLADFGVGFLLLGLVFIFFLIKASYFSMRNIRLEGHRYFYIYPLLILVSMASAVFLSTAPSCAQDLTAMWIYLAFLAIAADSLLKSPLKIISEDLQHEHE